MNRATSKGDAGRDALYKVAYDEIKTYAEELEPVTIGRLHRDLALHMRGSNARNLKRLDRLEALFQTASGILVAEVILWTVSIAV